MPRRPREENNKDNARQPDNGHWRSPPNRAAPSVSNNNLFVRYYRDVNPLYAQQADFDAFARRLETPLRQSFWFNSTDPLAATFASEIRQVGGAFVEAVPWFPDAGGAWRVVVDKEAFRKSPEVAPLRKLIVKLTDLGIISRQEEVSMIPPLLLQITKDDRCLDTCAAPGSKTAQMLVAIGRDCLAQRQQQQQQQQSVLPFDYTTARGFVVANELDETRSNMLVHQCKRIRLLYPFAIFTNHDARYFPCPVVNNSNADGGDNSAEFFDKVLCDVMCSGDGTIRKAPALLRAWRPFDAAHLQKSQIQVALRGAHLLRVGGRLVYSTCSMNPIENEAVVSQILQRTGGALRLVDPRPILPRLPCDPGMRTWKVMRNDGTIAEAADPQGALHPSLFPVPGADFPLELCMRLLPHHCDGGGFFIALFEKVAPFTIVRLAELPGQQQQQQQEQEQADEDADGDAQPEAAAVPADAGGGAAASAAAAAASALTKREEKRLITDRMVLSPFFAPPRDVVDGQIRDFLHIDPRVFPFDNMVYRRTDPQDGGGGQEQQQQDQQQRQLARYSTIQLVASGVRDVILGNSRNPAFRVSAAGLRTFVPQPGIGSYRIAHEAAPIVGPCMVAANSPRAFVDVSADDVIAPMINSGSALKDIGFDVLPNDAASQQLRDKVEALDVGCVLLRVRKSSAAAAVGDDGANISTGAGGAAAAAAAASSAVLGAAGDVWCPALRARMRIQLLVDGEDLVGLRCRLGLPTPEAAPAANAGGGAQAAPAAAGATETVQQE